MLSLAKRAGTCGEGTDAVGETGDGVAAALTEEGGLLYGTQVVEEVADTLQDAGDSGSSLFSHGYSGVPSTAENLYSYWSSVW